MLHRYGRMEYSNRTSDLLHYIHVGNLVVDWFLIIVTTTTTTTLTPTPTPTTPTTTHRRDGKTFYREQQTVQLKTFLTKMD